MPHFSQSSGRRLDTCHPSLVALFERVIERYDCTILEGHRSTSRQKELFRAGKSQLDGVVQRSKHQSNPSIAVDVVPYPINWKNTDRMRHFAGYVLACAHSMGLEIRCGIDWDGDVLTDDRGMLDQSFHDLPHFELLS